MLNFAPWFYRNLLVENDIIEKPEYFETILVNGLKIFEANVYLKKQLKPKWVGNSIIYKNCDGSGADLYKNTAVYKAISESLERLAFYELSDSHAKKFSFDLNPTTSGMAAFPAFSSNYARGNARAEAVERWALHEFNHRHLPIINHYSNIKGLQFFEIVTPFKDIKVTLLCFEQDDLYVYGFAGGSNKEKSFDKAIVELDRNLRMLSRMKNDLNLMDFSSTVDKTISFYSKLEGYNLFMEKIKSAPLKIINNNPKVLCDLELIGKWSKYTKVWRYLLEDSYYDYDSDYKFFMF